MVFKNETKTENWATKRYCTASRERQMSSRLSHLLGKESYSDYTVSVDVLAIDQIEVGIYESARCLSLVQGTSTRDRS